MTRQTLTQTRIEIDPMSAALYQSTSGYAYFKRRRNVIMQVMLFDNQENHAQITRRHNFDFNVGLLPSPVCCVICLDCH